MPAPAQETRSTRFFDRLTRRATVLRGAASVAAFNTRHATAQVATPVVEVTPAPDETASLLYIQNAGPTTLVPGAVDIHIPTMTQVLAHALYFWDRPNRIAGADPIEGFVATFGQTFADSPPNASLIGHLESGAQKEEAIVLTLLSAPTTPRRRR